MKNQIEVGSRVRWSRKFLRSICDYSHDSAKQTGTVKEFYKSGHMTIAQVLWDGKTELTGCNVLNLVRDDRIHLEPA